MRDYQRDPPHDGARVAPTDRPSSLGAFDGPGAEPRARRRGPMRLQRTAGNRAWSRCSRATMSGRRSTTSWARAAARRSTRGLAPRWSRRSGRRSTASASTRTAGPRSRPSPSVPMPTRLARTWCSGPATTTPARAGQRTIAHELSHVIQQSKGPVDGPRPPAGSRSAIRRTGSSRRPSTADQVMASVSSAQPSASDAGAGRAARGGRAVGRGPRSSATRSPRRKRKSRDPALDQPFPDRVGDGVGAVAQLEPRRHVVDDVLDGPLRVEQRPCDLGRVEAVGEQPEDGGLALGQPRECQPARRQDLALELPDLAQQPAQRRGGSVPSPAAAERSAADRLPGVASLRRMTPVTPASAADSRHRSSTRETRSTIRRTPRPRSARIAARTSSPPPRPPRGQRVLGRLAVGDDDEPLRTPQLADDPRPAQRVCGPDTRRESVP